MSPQEIFWPSAPHPGLWNVTKKSQNFIKACRVVEVFSIILILTPIIVSNQWEQWLGLFIERCFFYWRGNVWLVIKINKWQTANLITSLKSWGLSLSCNLTKTVRPCIISSDWMICYLKSYRQRLVNTTHLGKNTFVCDDVGNITLSNDNSSPYRVSGISDHQGTLKTILVSSEHIHPHILL